MADAPVKEGDLLAGRFRVERILGQGGMGVVVAARHLELRERVALKFLLPETSENAEVVARFIQEARAAARIHSEHVARVTDVGRLPSGAPYMVMEYLEGQDLSELLKARGPLPIADCVEYVLQACEALAEAHVRGIVHRDLKPANLFLTARADRSACIKVLDFGISKLVETGSASLALTGTSQGLIGSPLYMSPEQLASARDVDARADLWSLGVLMFELLTGRVPFMGQTLLQLCTLIVSQPIPRITLLRRDVPPELERVIERCLEKDRAHRYANIAELAVALQAFAPPHAITSVGRVSKVIRMAGGNVPSAPPPTPTPPGGGALPRGAVTEVTHAASTAGGDRVASAFPSRPPLRSALSLVGFVLGAALTLAVATFALHRLRSTSPGTAPGSTTVEAPPTPRELPPSSSPPAGPTADVGPSPAAAPSTIASAAPIASTSPDHPVHPSRRAAPPLRRPESAPLPATAKPEAPTVLPEDRK